MVTMICMMRWRIITKENMENICRGQETRKDSVNDDLESLFEDLRLGKEFSWNLFSLKNLLGIEQDKDTETYFLPRLTEEELELVETENQTFLRSFFHVVPDVPKAELMLWKSDSKYVDGVAWRKTFTIQNPIVAGLTDVTVSNKTNDELLAINARSRKVIFVPCFHKL